MNGILTELRRRNIFRVGSVYALTGWVVIRVAIALEQTLGLPDWFDTVVTSLLILCFPIALILSWIFEITPEGVKKTISVAPENSITSHTGHRLNMALGFALLIALCFILYDSFRTRGTEAPPIETQIVEAAQLSIAVLPFADLSPESNQAYFSDGISEELLNVLAQVPDLQVAGRTSSFAFKDKNQDLREIGEILDVAHILEGSVRKSGEQIRVTAQLIKVSDGFHVWSSNYNGDLSDIFKVQDEISQAILTELMPQLLGENKALSSTIKAPRAPMDVYELYLLSKQHARGGTFDDYKAAAAALDQALEIDDNYVPALAWRGYYEIMLSDAPGFQGVTPLDIAAERATNLINLALELDPNSADALFARATLYSTQSENSDKAKRDYRRALEIKPNFPIVQNDLAVLLETEFKFEEAFELLEEALSHDPALVDANYNLFQGYFWLSRFMDAQSVLDNWARISPDDKTLKRLEANFAFDTGAMAKGLELARALQAKTPETPLLTRFLTIGYYELGEYNKVLESDYKSLNPFALHRTGESEAAFELADKLVQERPNFPASQQSYINFLYAIGEWQALADYFDQTFGTLDKFANSDAYPPYELVAAAMLETNHPLAPQILEKGRAHIDQQRESRISLSVLDYEEATQLVLEGRNEEALDRLETAFSKGSYDLEIKANPVYARLKEDVRYQRLLERMKSAINTERDKLGLEAIELPK